MNLSGYYKKVVYIISLIFKVVSHLLVPPFCTYCKKLLEDNVIFCNDCYVAIKPVVSTRLVINAHYTMPVYALSSYQNPIRTLIVAKHYHDVIASKELGRLLAESLQRTMLEFDYIVPIPLHWTRYAYRGYNQAEVMAQCIAKATKKPLVKLLKRQKRTQFQTALAANDRKINVENAFAMAISPKNYSHYHGKKILIIDDLMTTGSTLHAAAKILVKLKPQQLMGAVIARVI